MVVAGCIAKTARVADIGDVIEHLQRVDEAAAGLLAAGEFEADEAAQPALEITLRPLTVHAGLHRRVNDASNLRPLAQEVGHRLRVLACLAMRSVTVSTPCRIRNALNGDIAEPMSRSSVTRALMI